MGSRSGKSLWHSLQEIFTCRQLGSLRLLFVICSQVAGGGVPLAAQSEKCPSFTYASWAVTKYVGKENEVLLSPSWQAFYLQHWKNFLTLSTCGSSTKNKSRFIKKTYLYTLSLRFLTSQEAKKTYDLWCYKNLYTLPLALSFSNLKRQNQIDTRNDTDLN